jgi:hypothetical protein
MSVLLLGCGGFGGGVGILFGEALDTAGGVKQFLLSTRSISPLMVERV